MSVGTAGKALFNGDLPWYVIAGAGALVVFIGKSIAKVAGDALKEINDADEKEKKI